MACVRQTTCQFPMAEENICLFFGRPLVIVEASIDRFVGRPRHLFIYLLVGIISRTSRSVRSLFSIGWRPRDTGRTMGLPARLLFGLLSHQVTPGQECTFSTQNKTLEYPFYCILPLTLLAGSGGIFIIACDRLKILRLLGN